MHISPLSHEEKLQIVEQIIHMDIFSILNIAPNDMHLIPTIFLPILFMEKEALKDIGFVYEKMEKAEFRGCNGYPCFVSCKLVNIEDTNWILKRLKVATQTLAHDA